MYEWYKSFAVKALKYKLGMGVAEEELKQALPPSLQTHAIEIADAIFNEIVLVEGKSCTCLLCARPNLTVRGLYLHLVRVHMEELQRILSVEVESIIARYKKGI
uniref:Uncharacterized protein n=1 Tax=Fervidicoccus fontis TaxID=683846 RepID=A0A7J3ZM04_9CREN